MAHYTFRNKETNEEFDIEMSMADHGQYVKDNPHLVQVLKNIKIADPVRIGITQPPRDFSKYVLGKVKEVPGANKDTIEKRYQIAKEI